MNNPILKFENISKQYRLGLVGTGTISHDLNRWWYQFRGKEDPYLKIGEANDRSTKGNSQYVWALKDINFEVKQGDVLGIIGKNGAGKSTLLKILSKVTSPTTGIIKSKGRIASLLEVGTGFHPELTGRENIYVNGAILGMSKSEITTKLDEIVDFSGCERYIDTPVKRYSSGMTVRLAFAVAAHLEPEILVVDEVLAVGDAEFQKKAVGKMHDISKGEGRTVLFVSHNMGAVQSLCSTGIFLKNGTIVSSGRINHVLSAYLKSVENLAEVDLLDRTDRKGKGDCLLTKVEINSGDYNSSSNLSTGNPCRFTFFLSKLLPDTKCIFTIYDHLGQAIANFNSQIHSPIDIVKKSTNSKIICQIEELPLVPGRYRLNVSISSQAVLQDHVEGAAVFDVEGGNFRKRPINKSSGYGSVHIPHQWILPRT